MRVSTVFHYSNILAACAVDGHSTSVTFAGRMNGTIIYAMMNSLTRIPSWATSHWRATAILACATIGAIVTLRWSRDDNPGRSEQSREKDIQKLAEKISKYAHKTHAAYPTGDVIVSENDLATQLHRAPEKIATALCLLHSQQKVERAPLSGYWKLNV